MKLTIDELLKKYYGYGSFRPGQAEIIDHILGGRDICAVMPTGSGKSVCYQIPALALPGITLVISPLISLMQDQVRVLKAAGIAAAYINSALTPAQVSLALQRASAGAYKIIYVAPERLESPGFISFAVRAGISLIAVDEAHCISVWGQDFRPGYRRIADFTDKLEKRPVIAAFTATANKRVRDDIVNKLRLKDPYFLTTGFDRPNLYFGTLTPEDDGFSDPKMSFILRYLARHKDESGIIYCLTKKQTETVASFLNSKGYNAGAYHAGMDNDLRRRIQEDFTFGRIKLIAATSAFGMGIDKPDVRFVLHYSMPPRIEQYYQEAGRAGRDGEKAECILLYSPADYYFIKKYFILREDDGEKESAMTPQEKEEYTAAQLDELEKMRFYSASGRYCLRRQILHYFGEKTDSPCGNCSCCNNDIYSRCMPDKKKAGYDEELFIRLKAKALLLSMRTGVPVFAIADDKMLRGLSEQKPKNENGLRMIPGFSTVKIRQYGREFLEIIREYDNIPKV